MDLITFSLYITTFVNPVRKLANFSELLANGTAGFSRFLELMRTEPAMKDAPDAVELTDVKGQVDVDHVSFAYEGDLDVLHDVDLHIQAGRDAGGGGPLRRRKVYPVPADPPVLRCDGRRCPHRWTGCPPRDPALSATAGGRGAAGCISVR